MKNLSFLCFHFAERKKSCFPFFSQKWKFFFFHEWKFSFVPTPDVTEHVLRLKRGLYLYPVPSLSDYFSLCQLISLNSRISNFLSSDSRNSIKSGLSRKFVTTNSMQSSKKATSGVISRLPVIYRFFENYRFSIFR